MWGCRAVVAAFLGLTSAAVAAPAPDAVIGRYADMAAAIYGDSAAKARDLQSAVNAFLAHPDAGTLTAARNAWKAARVPYLQTEGFRFANSVVDDWEPKVNAWPLDEGLIDYVAPSYGTTSDQNPLYTLNVIGSTKLRIGAKMVDATTIDTALLRSLQEAEGVQANVSTGFHAIEFLLWGQNLKGLSGGAGERPPSDYDPAHCTHGNCARRAAYLKAASDLLVADLDEMAADWRAGGKARAELTAKGNDGGLSDILTGLGSLTFGEMTGERMKLGLMLHDPEEQQDCFSNNTHNSHYYDEIGIGQIWRGEYAGAAGPNLRGYAASLDPAAAKRMDGALAAALAAIARMKDAAESGKMAYSQMIAAGNADGNKMVQDAMDALVAQTRAIEAVAASLHLKVNSGKSDHAGSALK
ncbi:MAG TPA: imelysin family protein [Rhizomicrobium sp.]|nr:imelysin family protein [Rhizomicrobium sp.]